MGSKQRSDVSECGGALWVPKKKSYTKCLRCGRALKTDEAKERGYGKICWQKRLLDTQEMLF